MSQSPTDKEALRRKRSVLFALWNGREVPSPRKTSDISDAAKHLLNISPDQYQPDERLEK